MIHFISFQYVVEIHDYLIDEYGGRKGLLNEGLLKSALEMPKARFNNKPLCRTVFDKAAAYLFHLIQNHPFVDGNKRTASMITMIFLTANCQKDLSIVDQDYQEMILNVARGEVMKNEIARFFRRAELKQ